MRAWIVCLLLAGCAQSVAPPPDEPLPWAALALPYGPDHDHSDPSHHLDGTTPNFVPLAHEPMESLHYGATAGGYLCGDVQRTRDGRALAAVESRSDVGFALVDVTDPVAPKWLGELVMENAYVYDLAVVPDGKHVVLVTSTAKGLPAPRGPAPEADVAGKTAPEADVAGKTASEAGAAGATVQGAAVSSDVKSAGSGVAPDAAAGKQAGSAGGDLDEQDRDVLSAAAETEGGVGAAVPRLLWNSPCGTTTSDPLPYEDLVLLVDIQEPAAPRVVQALRLAGHGHSAFTVDMGGRLVVLAVSLGPDGINSWAHLFGVQETPTGAALVPLAVYKGEAGPPPAAQRMLGQVWHDGWIARHPGTGMWLLHLVGQHAYTILDLDDPSRPRHLSTWSDDDPAAGVWTGNLHSVVPLTEMWDGRHYTIIGPEWAHRPEDHPSGILRVLDTTDPTSPSEVGAWTLPVDVEWEEGAVYQFSNHYYAIDGRTLFASMYHGGVWAVDLRPIGTAPWVNLPTLGVWQPLAPDVASAVHVRWAPTNQEVFVHEGTLVTFDSNTGLHTARFDHAVAVVPPDPWPLAPLHR